MAVKNDIRPNKIPARGGRSITINKQAGGASQKVYVRYATDASGSGFTNTPGPATTYIGIIVSDVVIPIPNATHFTGKWFNWKGAPGGAVNTIITTAGLPVDADGNDGDFCISTSLALLIGPKAGGVWPAEGINIMGPPGQQGDKGDTGDQGPAGIGLEGPEGPQGQPGNTIIYGSGAPSNSIGNNGDSYIDTAGNNIYYNKSGGVWPEGVSIKGLKGDTGNTGASGNTIIYGLGAPSNAVGNNGDSYIDKTNNAIYYNKAAGVWPAGTSIIGPQGIQGTPGSPGVQGDKPGSQYLFGSSTGNADPGNGKFRFSVASLTPGATGTFRISKTDNDAGDAGARITAALVNDFIDISSNANAGATNIRLQVTSIAAIVGTTYYNMGYKCVYGSLPAANEEVAIRFQQGPNISWDSTTKKLLDSLGNEISGPLVFDTLADAYAVGAAALGTIGLFVKNPSGVHGSPTAFFCDGADIKASGGEYIYDRLTGIQPKIIWPNNTGLTWTASNNAGLVRLTASAAHGLTDPTAIGCSLALTNTPANWVAGSFHKIKSSGIVSTTVIDLETAWVTGMGTAPTFAAVGTAVTAFASTLPALKDSSAVIFDSSMFTNVGTCNRNITLVLDTTTLQDHVFSNTSNSFSPEKLGFRNVSATNAQEGLYNTNSNGLVSSGNSQITNGAVQTNAAGKTLKINVSVNTVNFFVQIGNGRLYIIE